MFIVGTWMTLVLQLEEKIICYLKDMNMIIKKWIDYCSVNLLEINDLTNTGTKAEVIVEWSGQSKFRYSKQRW